MRKHDNPGRPNSASLGQTSPPEGYPYLPAACPHGLIRLRIYRPAPTTKSVNTDWLPNPRHTKPTLHMCQLRASYDRATNATLSRYKSRFHRYEECSVLHLPPLLRPSHICHPTSRRNPPYPPPRPNARHPTPIRHMCQLRPSYDHSTNSTPRRYESRFFSYEGVECSYLCVDANPLNIPAPTHDEIRQPRPTPQISLVGLSGPIRASYGSGTNGTVLRYKSLFRSYKPSPTPYLEWHRPPAEFPARQRLVLLRLTNIPQTIIAIMAQAAKPWYLAYTRRASLGLPWWRAGHPCQGKPGPVSGC